MADTKLSAETNHVTTFNGDERIRVCDDPGGVPATGYSTFGDLFPGYIGDNGAQLLYVGAAAYSVLPGSANVNGTILTWASNIARSGLSLSANTLYYVYLYDNSGTPAVEESTTAPVWDATLNYWKKTGDDTRRRIGYITVNATPAIAPFINIVMGRISEIYFVGGLTNLVNTGSATSWTSFSLSPIVPADATHWWALAKSIYTSALDDAAVGLSPSDAGAVVATSAMQAMRNTSETAGKATYFGFNWLPITTAQTYYYKLQHLTGTSAVVTIAVSGAKFIR